LLLECERQVNEPEAALRCLPSRPEPLAALPSPGATYIRERRETLEADPERAHTLLAKVIDP